jgi:centromeric protein E
MLGSKGSPGVLPLAVNEIMNCISQAPHRAFLIRCSYIEIYKETITDLLSKKTLEVHESKAKGIHVDAQENIISNADEIMACLATGEEHRHTGRTGMNERSSRSHTIFRIIVESRAISDDSSSAPAASGGNVTLGTLNLVDLAGSESVRTTNATGERLVEAKMINTSLLTLSRVIKELAESGKSVNYRESKLTRVLQPSLAGNTKLTVICCINPSRQYQEESKTTLEFAAHANGIRMSAAVNTVLDENAKMKTLQKELAAVREQLKKLQEVAVASAAGPVVAVGLVPAMASTVNSAASNTTALSDSSSSSSRVPFSDASNAANGTNGAGDLSASSLIATPAADLVGKSSVELIAHYEAQLQNMRTRMFIGGTKHDEVTDTGYTELGRIKSFSAIRSQAAMGRSKRHRETWCPAAGGGGELRKSFLMGLKKGGGASSSSSSTSITEVGETEEEEGNYSNGSGSSGGKRSGRSGEEEGEEEIRRPPATAASGSALNGEEDNQLDEEEVETDNEAEAGDDSDNDGLVTFSKVRKVASTEDSVVLQGGSGSGGIITISNENEAQPLSSFSITSSSSSSKSSLTLQEKAEFIELKRELAEKDASIVELHAQADAMLERNEAVEAEMHRLASSESSLGAEVRALSARLAEEMSTKAAMEATMKSSTIDFTAKITDMEATYGAKIADLEAKLSLLQEEAAASAASSSAAETKAWAAEKASKAADARARAGKDAAAAAEEKASEAAAKLLAMEETHRLALEAANASHRLALEAANASIDEAQARASASTSKASALASDLGEARAEAAGLEAKYQALKAQLGATSESAAQLAEQQENAARELSLLRSALATSQEERDNSANEVTALTIDAKALKREIADLNFKLSSLNEDADRSEREAEEAAEKIAAAETLTATLQSQITVLDGTVDDLNKKKSEIESENTVLQSRLTEVLSTLESLRAYTSSLETTNANAQTEIEKLTNDASSSESNLRASVDSLTAQIAKLQGEAEVSYRALADAASLDASLKRAQAELATATTEATANRSALLYAASILKSVQSYFTHLNSLPTTDSDPATLADYLQDLAPSTNGICDELQSIIAPTLALVANSQEDAGGGPISGISSAAEAVSSAIFTFNEVCFNASGLIYDVLKARDAAVSELEMQSSELKSRDASDSEAATAALAAAAAEHARVVEELQSEASRSMNAFKAEVYAQTEQLKEELSRTQADAAAVEERRLKLETELITAKDDHVRETQAAVQAALQEAATQAATKGHGVEGLLQNYAAEMSQIKVQLSLASGEVDAAKEAARLANEAAASAKTALVSMQNERDIALAAASAAEMRATSLAATLASTSDALASFTSREASEKNAETALSVATATVARLTSRVAELESVSSLVETLQAETERARNVKDSIAAENARLSLKNYELGLSEASAKEAATLATSEADRARAELTGLKSQLEQAKSDVTRYTSQLEMSRLELGSLQATYERTCTQLEQARETSSTLQSQVAKKEEALQEYSLRFNEAESYAQSAIAALETQRSHEAQAAAAALAESTLQLDAANAAIIDLRGTIDERGEAAEAAESRALDLANALEMADVRIEKLNAQLAAVRGAAQHAEALSAARGADIAAISDKFNTLKVHLESAEAENARLTARCERLDRAKLTDAQTKKMIAIKKEYDVLKVQVHELSAEKLRLETLLAATSASSKTQESKIVADLQARLAQAEANAGRYSDMRAALEVALEEAKGGIEDANALAKDKGEEAERLRSQATDARAALHTAQDTIAKMASSSAVLAATLNSASPAIALAGLEDLHLATTAAPHDVSSRAREVVDALSIKLQQLSSTHSSTLQQMAKTEAASAARTCQFEGDLQSVKEQLSKGEREIQSLRETISRLQGEAKANKARAADAEKEAEAVRARIHQIERINADLASKAQDKTNALSEAAAEHARSLQFLEKENLALMMELRSLRSSAASAQALATSSRPAPRLSVIKSNPGFTGAAANAANARMSMGGNAHSMQAQMFASQQQQWQQQQVLMQHQNIHAQLSAQPLVSLPMPGVSAASTTTTTMAASQLHPASSSVGHSAASSTALASSTASLSHPEPSSADTSMIDALASAPSLPQLSSSQMLGSSGLGRRQPLSAIAGGVNAAAPLSEQGGGSAASLAASKLGASRVLLAPRGNGGGGVVHANNTAGGAEKEGECAQQ